jgi:predicted Zn-dependent protease
MMNSSSVSQAKSSSTPELRARAEAGLRSGELKEASALALELSLHPSVQAWDRVVITRIAAANGESAAAIKWLQAAQGELPEEGAVLVHLAVSFAAAKKSSSAASTLDSAIAKRPDIADLHQHHDIYISNACQAFRSRCGQILLCLECLA